MLDLLFEIGKLGGKTMQFSYGFRDYTLLKNAKHLRILKYIKD